MHQVSYSIRTIAPGDLPPVTLLDGSSRDATVEELANLGMVPLGDDLYSCLEQHRRDPETLVWALHGEALPGEVVAQGSLRQRHAALPDEVRPKVLRAQVIRSEDPATSAAALAEATAAEAAAQLAEYVGDVDGAPLVDLTTPAALLDEAQRLVEIPGNGVDRQLVPMANVDAGDVVELDGLIPHRWQGESTR